MPRLSRPLTVVATAALVGAVLLGGGAAWAAWVVSGTGNGAAAVNSLVSPTVTASARSSTSIDLSWTATNQLPGATYSVTRGGTPITSCTASPCTDSGLTPGTSYSYVVSANIGTTWSAAGNASATTVAVASSYAVSVQSPVTAGTPAQVTITAKRSDNTTDTAYSGARTITLSGPATAASPGGTNASSLVVSANFSNGVVVVTPTLVSAGGGLGLTATSSAPGSLSGSTTLTVNAASASDLGLTSVVVKDSAGTAIANTCLFSCTVTKVGSSATIETKVSLVDSYGNVATHVGGDLTVNTAVTSGGSRTPTSLVIPAGSSTSSSTVTMTTGSASNTTLTLNASPNYQVQATLQKN